MIEWIVGGLGAVVIAQAEYWIREHWTRCRERDAKLEKQARATRIAEKRRWVAEERHIRDVAELYRQRAEQTGQKTAPEVLEARAAQGISPTWLAMQRSALEQLRAQQSDLARDYFAGMIDRQCAAAGLGVYVDDTGTGPYRGGNPNYGCRGPG